MASKDVELFMETTDSVSRLLGTDPWIRFDMWSARAWEAAEQATKLAMQHSMPISQEDVIFDPRVATLFHAAEVAKEIAMTVNPILASAGMELTIVDQEEEDEDCTEYDASVETEE